MKRALLAAVISKPFTLGPEMLVNGTFGDETGWTLPSEVTIGSGALNYATSSVRSSTGAVSPSFVPGGRYRVEFTITALTSGSARITVGGTPGASRVAVGTYTQDYTAISPAGVITVTGLSSATTLSIDNISVKEIL